MSFTENNKHFIYHSIVVGMRNLTQKEKLKKYETFKNGNLTIKEEFRQRIREYYYNNCKSSTLLLFYEELFNLLGFCEGEYLISNLIYETNAISIINHLCLNKSFTQIQFKNENSIAEKFLSNIISKYTKNKAYYKSNYDKHFISQLNLIMGIYDEYKLIKSENALIKMYPNWLAKNLEYENKSCVNSFLYFVEIWQFLNLKSVNSSAILLLHNFIVEYKTKVSNQLHNFINNTEAIFNELFVSIIFIPLLDKKNLCDFGEGYEIRQKEFDVLVKTSCIIDSINENDSYFNLFKALSQHQNSSVKRKIVDLIFLKIAKHHFLNKEEIKNIQSRSLNASEKLLLISMLKKLYLFEYYDYENELKIQYTNNDLIYLVAK